MKADFFKREIATQKKRKTPDENYIKLMKLLIDKEVTLENYINTGRIMNVNYYEEEYGLPPFIEEDCFDVIRYAGGFVIQILSTGEYKYNHFELETNVTYVSKKLDDVEKEMWDRVVSHLVV